MARFEAVGASPTAMVDRRLTRAGWDWRSLLVEAGLLLSLLVTLGILAVLLTDIAVKAFPVFTERPLDFLTSPVSSRPARAGILQGILGSTILTTIVALLALPLGIACGVYLEEYARASGVTGFIRTNIRNLAGVPSIVYGLLGLAVFVSLLGLTGALAGGLTLAILVLPIVVITSSEALRAVPGSIREAAYGVGATRWETVRQHVLPYAAPGILTGTILSLARAFGETAPLLMVVAIAGTFSSTDPLAILTGPYTALPTMVYDFAGKPQEEFRALTAATIVVLLVVILLVNATAIILRNRYDRTW
jgi:phosphate transport system permease protein